MKKMILSLLAVAATMSAMAITYNAKATIILTSPNNNTAKLIIAESDDLAEVLTNGYYAELITEGLDAALYIEYNGVKYMHFATKSLDEMTLGTWFSADAPDGDYTLTVSAVSGTETLKIKIGDEVIELTAGTSKTVSRAALAATSNQVNPTPAVPGICHQNGKLQFTAYKGASVQVVEYDDNTKVAVAATNITLDYQEIDLAALAAGQYLVIVTKADQTEEKLVIKK